MSVRSEATVAEPNATPPPPTDAGSEPPQLVNELPDPREKNDVRLPRAVQAVYLQPLRRETEYGVPSCDLQLRSYSIPNLEFFCDFALRAAYYLNLPAFGPVPLPKIIERWTVPRASFIFKKSQENFERITRRRLIQIRDGHPETVQIWLAYLQKHAYYGIGMKANMWSYDKLATGEQMDSDVKTMQETIEAKMQYLGRDKTAGTVEKFHSTVLLKSSFNRPSSLVNAATRTRRRLASGQFLSPRCSYSQSAFQEKGEKGTQDDEQMPVVFSGIQPTGVPHLGNYLGAMRQWKQLQDNAPDDTELLFSIVDLHAITMPRDAPVLMQHKREMLAALIAIGLDPKKSTMFYQSSVPEHTELMWILSCTASMGYLGRMTQWKAREFDDTVAAQLKLGLFSYPVLQAADILVHRATHVPVGADQLQHLEFARECVTNFNSAYGPHLIAPQTITTPSSRVMSLVNPLNKMSKSVPNHRSRILITAPPEEIQQRIMGAVTDSQYAVTYEPAIRPGVANLLEILAQCATATTIATGGEYRGDVAATPPTPATLAQAFAGMHLGDLKKAVVNAVTQELSGVRERFEDALNRGGGKYLDNIQAEGAERARENAAETMRIVRDAVGLSAV
ncbi:Tryptophan--tRNA ligase, mitochondrial [Diatrype stigma]|uniref:Small ribosomal subunit protein uS10m n=1 Tax=Diatrype stigma TaxID=117547 RepID=A0AAN9UKW4_9PEZI